MTEQQWPTMTGWRKRERAAKERQRRKDAMASIRAARKANREGIAQEPTQAPVSAREGDSAPVAPDYPNADEMDRAALFAYLQAHGVNPGPASKDETLRKRVIEVRDGEATPAA